MRDRLCTGLVDRGGATTEAVFAPTLTFSGSFTAFASDTKSLLAFMRALLDACAELGLESYQLQLVPRGGFDTHRGDIELTGEVLLAAEEAGFCCFIHADGQPRSGPLTVGPSFDMRTAVAYIDRSGKPVSLALTAQDICVVDGESMRCFYDGQALPVYVTAPNIFVREFGQLSDDELTEFWRCVPPPQLSECRLRSYCTVQSCR
jgi:hypothetical protein